MELIKNAIIYGTSLIVVSIAVGISIVVITTCFNEVRKLRGKDK